MLVAEDVDILINMFLCYMMGCQKNVYDFCRGKNVSQSVTSVIKGGVLLCSVEWADMELWSV